MKVRFYINFPSLIMVVVFFVWSMSCFAKKESCSQSNLQKIAKSLQMFAGRSSPNILESRIIKRKAHYIKWHGKIDVKDTLKPIETTYYYYKTRNIEKGKKAPLLFVFSGVGGITLLERYIANYFTKRGVSVVLTEFMEIRDLDSIQTLQPKLLRSIKSALGLVDYFSTFKDIDQDKISAIGISFGGFRTLYLMGLDMRIKGATIVVAGSSFARSLAYSTLPFIKKIRELQMAYTGITRIEDYIAELEKSLTIKPTDLLCRRSKDDFFLYMAYKDSVVPYSLQEELWHSLDTPFVKRVKFGHYGGALYFGMSNLKETMEFMKYSWYK